VTTGDACTIRPYRPGDETALAGLFARVFGRAMSEAEWCWKLQHSDFSGANVWVAEENGALVSQYAGIPSRHYLSGRTVVGMTAVDAMTHPAYRRRGLLTRTVRAAHAHWRERGVSFVVGLPNEQWGSRTAALGWRPLTELRWLLRPLRPEALLASRLKVRGLARLPWVAWGWNGAWNLTMARSHDVVISAVDAGNGRLDIGPLGPNPGVGVVRDNRWIRWRYLDAPSHGTVLIARRDERADGYAAYRHGHRGDARVGLIADLQAVDGRPGTLDALLHTLIGRLRREDVVLAAALAVPGSGLYRLLRRAGFLFSWGAFHVHVVPLDDAIDERFLADPGRWNLAGGDFDVV
jgi:predicted N-acetyltransferase YhbS